MARSRRIERFGTGPALLGARVTTTTARLRTDQRDELRSFIAAVAKAEGRSPLSENKAMRLDGALDAREIVVVEDAGYLMGYGQAAWHRGVGDGPGHWALEVVVAPQRRDSGIVARLIEDLRAEVGDVRATLWSRSDYVAEAAVATGWVQERVLWEMHAPLPVDVGGSIAPGFRFDTFHVGRDEGVWLEANNLAFAGHPENGQMNRRDLEARMAQDWFDSSGFILAWHGTQLAGSCWTKVHDDGVGEIYIIGVVPDWEGYGLGRVLVEMGLEHLAAVGQATDAMLFVESSNERAINLYRQLGFEMVRSVAAYRYPPNT